MKENYDFSGGIRNPYFERLKGFQNIGRIIASVKVNNVTDRR